MTDQLLIISTAIAFIIAGFVTRNIKTNTLDNFSTRRNKINGFVTASGVCMTFVGGAALINMASLGYTFKWDILVDPIAFSLGIIIVILFMKKYRSDAGVTISELFSSNHKYLSLIIGILTSVIFLLITSAQFVAFSKLLSPYFPNINPSLFVIIPSAIILIYLFLGGFSAVTNTDVLQLIIAIFFLLIPVGYLFFSSNYMPNPPQYTENTFIHMPLNLIVLLSIPVLYLPISQDINIRAKSAKSYKSSIFGFIGGALFYSAIIIACSYMGILLAKNGVKLADTEQAYPTFFNHFFPKYGILAILAGMAAIWSSLDTFLLNGITSVAQDLFKKNSLLNKLEERKLIILAGITVYLIALLIAIYFYQVLSLVLTAMLIYISVLLPIAFAKLIKLKDNVIFICSLLIIFTIIIIEITKIEIDLKAIYYPLFGFGYVLITYFITKFTKT